MKAYQIKDVKIFMGILLGTDAFDSFLLAEASITTCNTFFIDGHMVREFFTGDPHDASAMPPYEFSEWKNMRSLCFDLIKGRRTPVSLKLILHLKPELTDRILKANDCGLSSSDVRAFVLNIKYDGRMLTCITATAFYTFLPDKTPDNLWDDYFAHFLSEKELTHEEI